MKAIIQAAEVAVAEAKNYLEALYNNDTVSLEEKWEAFKAAPNYLKNHARWVNDFDSLPPDTIGYDCPVHAERYSTKDTLDVVDILEDREFEEDVINTFKQEVLKKNLGSFEYDW